MINVPSTAPLIPENPRSSQSNREMHQVVVLLNLVGVEPFVFRTTVRWALMQKGWRALFVKMALLAALWSAVAFVFATEIYLSQRGGPIEFSWKIAASSAFRDWFPWILLSPVAVLLAGKFRFRRNAWRQSLMVHLAAALLITVAYQGLSFLVAPTPFILSTGAIGGSVGAISTGGPGPLGMAVDVSAEGFIPPPGLFQANSNATLIEQGQIFSAGAAAMPPGVVSNILFVTSMPDAPSFHAAPGGMRSAFRVFSPPNWWARFLHLAMLRMQFTIPIYLCIVCVCWVSNHFQEASEQERRTLELETRLTQANLQTLKMQLQPHFLFNTLNAISSLVYENPKVADDMLGSLSQFLRTTLEVASKNVVPLRAELEFVDRYLEIQQTRFGDRLRIHREVDSAILDALVPPLILQPLAENAVRYGIEPRETGGTLSIRALREGVELSLEISDDGEGFSGSHILKPGNGVGLSNTKARLEALYGSHHQFKLTANQPNGACVKIQIPFQLSPSDAQPDT